MTKPSTVNIPNEIWEETSKDVQAYITQITAEHNKIVHENETLKRRTQRFRTATSIVLIITALLIASLAVMGNWFVRPYLRVMRSENNSIISCIYRPSTTYRISERDTLFGISIFYGVPVEVIASANGITDINRIRVGQEITIPESPCVDAAVVTQIAAEPLTATVEMATNSVQHTQTMSAWMTEFSPSNITATAIRAETATAQYTPPNLTRTTATPTSNLDPLELTATEIIREATQAQIDFIRTATAETSTPSP